MLPSRIRPFQYLTEWILRNRVTRLNLVLREVGSLIPAKAIFRLESEWEVVELKQPYSPNDSADISRWYRTVEPLQ